MTTTEESVFDSQLMRFAADVVLRSGSTLRLRPVFATDAPRVLDFLEKMSPESMQMRFAAARRPDAALAVSMSQNDPYGTFGVVGELADEIVAIAHYYRSRPDDPVAESAFTIRDGFQGQGIGTRLLEKLAEVGREYGVKRFEAEVLPMNHLMIKVFLDSGFDVQKSSDGEQLHFELSLEETESFQDRSYDRSREAATASMKAIFEPRSIAVVGASRRRGQMGAELFRNLIRSGFNGRLYPVNTMAHEVEYVPAYASVRDIPGEVDLAFIVVPAAEAETVVDDCIEKKVRGIVVLSSGFSETGAEGREREQRLVEKIRSAGIRMVGPNSMGLLNTDPNIRLHGTFSPTDPPHGTVAMSTQSGALGLATLDYARKLNIGFSTFISVGNKADVSGNDLVQYWADDPRTEVILLYLESFGNPKKFSSIARRIARKKPIVAVKAGRSETGARAALLHTGAAAASDAVVDDLFRQAGVIRTDTLEEMFDVAMLLANQPLPRGRRVAILTNAGGPAVLAADACEARGLNLASFSESTITELKAFLQDEGSFANPVDLSPYAPAERYWRAMEVILEDPNVDTLIVIHIPIYSDDLDAVARGIKEGAAASGGKTVVGTIMSAQGVPAALSPLPCFPFPERAVAALARVTNYAEWRRRPRGRTHRFEDIDIDRARRATSSKADGGGWLSADDARELIEAAGIRVLPAFRVGSEEEAVATARRIGYPVVMKGLVSSLRRGTETPIVKLSISDDEAVRVAWTEINERLESRLVDVVVQRMITEGTEVMIGATEQPTFGTLLFYGVAGASYDVVPDISFRFHPVTDVDVADMMEEALITTSLRRNVEAIGGEERLQDAILRLSCLLEECPEIRELEITPLKVVGEEVFGLAVRARVGPAEINRVARRVAY